MSRLLCDLHLHSCLSPCGDDEMTPANLVNMAALLGCHMIALTDHNTCRNTPAAVAAGALAGIVVVPGMELCTAEEAHVVCLLPGVEQALAFGGEVARHLPPMKNDPDIFGRQLVMDENDGLIDEEEALLIAATDISVDDVVALVRRFGGAALPAHVDRASYSVLSSLGALPPEAGFAAAEVTAAADLPAMLAAHPELSGLMLPCGSDAHYLENMVAPCFWIDLPQATPACLIAALNGETATKWGRLS